MADSASDQPLQDTAWTDLVQAALDEPERDMRFRRLLCLGHIHAQVKETVPAGKEPQENAESESRWQGQGQDNANTRR